MTRTADLREVRLPQTPADNAPGWQSIVSAADLAADPVLLLIERALLGAGDVTAVLARHEALLGADEPVLSVQSTRLAATDFAFATLLIDSRILVVEACIDLGAARMILIPCAGIRKLGRACDDTERKHDDGDARNIGDGEHWLLPFRKRGVDSPHVGTMPMRWLSQAEQPIHEPDKSMAQRWQLSRRDGIWLRRVRSG